MMDFNEGQDRDFIKAIIDEILGASAHGYAAVLDMLAPAVVERLLNEYGSSVTYDKDDSGRISIRADLPDGSYGRVLGYAWEY